MRPALPRFKWSVVAGWKLPLDTAPWVELPRKAAEPELSVPNSKFPVLDVMPPDDCVMPEIPVVVRVLTLGFDVPATADELV